MMDDQDMVPEVQITNIQLANGVCTVLHSGRLTTTFLWSVDAWIKPQAMVWLNDNSIDYSGW